MALLSKGIHYSGFRIIPRNPTLCLSTPNGDLQMVNTFDTDLYIQREINDRLP